MKIILLAFLTTFLILSNLKAEIVKKIEINGNKRVSEETVIIYGEIQLNQDYFNKDLNKILQNIYSTNFFEDVKIDLKNNILKINLTEYPTVNQLIIVGEKSKKIWNK